MIKIPVARIDMVGSLNHPMIQIDIHPSNFSGKYKSPKVHQATNFFNIITTKEKIKYSMFSIKCGRKVAMYNSGVHLEPPHKMLLQ